MYMYVIFVGAAHAGLEASIIRPVRIQWGPGRDGVNYDKQNRSPSAAENNDDRFAHTVGKRFGIGIKLA